MDAHTGRPAPGNDRLTSRDVRIWVASEPLDNAVLAAADDSAPENVNRPAVDTHVGGFSTYPLRTCTGFESSVPPIRTACGTARAGPLRVPRLRLAVL